MSGSNSTILIIAGIGVGLLALLLLLGSGPEPTNNISAVPLSVTTGEPDVRAAAPSIPVVHAGLDRTVGERERVELSGEGYDPSGSPVTYQWTAQGGLGFFENAHSPTTVFTAPSACDCNETVILTLTVTNSAGQSVFDQMVISVRDPLACPETTCEASDYYEIMPVDLCLDHAADATCPATPSIACDSPCIAEVAVVDECANAAVPCPCTENANCSEPWQTGWPFDAQPGHPKDRAKPSIDRHFPRMIDEDTSIPLEGFIRNPACQSVCYSWTASKGWLENSNTLTPIYHAPESDRLEGETVTISLVVYDTAGGRSYDQIRIKIRNANPG